MPGCRRVTAFTEFYCSQTKCHAVQLINSNKRLWKSIGLFQAFRQREVFSKDSEGVRRSLFAPLDLRHLNASKRLEINKGPVSGENESKCSALNNKRINFIWLFNNRPPRKKIELRTYWNIAYLSRRSGVSASSCIHETVGCHEY